MSRTLLLHHQPASWPRCCCHRHQHPVQRDADLATSRPDREPICTRSPAAPRNILASLEEPLTLRLYLSRKLARTSIPSISTAMPTG